jgi:hypothetical protein
MMMMMMRLVLVLLVQETRNDNALPSPGLTEGLVVMLGNASVRGTGEVADEDGGDVPEPRQWQCVPCRSSLGGGPCPRRNEGESRGAVLTLEFRSFHAHSARTKRNPPPPPPDSNYCTGNPPGGVVPTYRNQSLWRKLPFTKKVRVDPEIRKILCRS